MTGDHRKTRDIGSRVGFNQPPSKRCPHKDQSPVFLRISVSKFNVPVSTAYEDKEGGLPRTVKTWFSGLLRTVVLESFASGSMSINWKENRIAFDLRLARQRKLGE